MTRSGRGARYPVARRRRHQRWASGCAWSAAGVIGAGRLRGWAVGRRRRVQDPQRDERTVLARDLALDVPLIERFMIFGTVLSNTKDSPTNNLRFGL